MFLLIKKSNLARFYKDSIIFGKVMAFLVLMIIYKDIAEFSISRATLLEENACKFRTVIDIDFFFQIRMMNWLHTFIKRGAIKTVLWG